MRIVQVTSGREPKYGAYVSMMTLAEELRAEHHDVRFVALKEGPITADLVSRGFHVDLIPAKAKVDPVCISRLAKNFRGADVAQFHLSTACVNGGLAARLAGIPGFGTVHGMSGKLSFVTCSRLIAVSAAVKEHMTEQGLKDERIEVVPNGVRPRAHLPREEALRHLGLDPGRRWFGFVSRLTALKGPELALRAFAAAAADLPDWSVFLAGDGPMASELQHLALSLEIGDRVRFLGFRRDVDAAWDAMDVFLFPSQKEAMGLVAVEALMAGKPVIASDVDGIPAVVGEAGACLPINVEAWAHELVRWGRDESLRDATKPLTQAQAAQYSSLRMRELTEHAFLRAL